MRVGGAMSFKCQRLKHVSGWPIDVGLLVVVTNNNLIFLSNIDNDTKTKKKSELMLMRRVRANSSLCSQVILVCLHPFRRSSLFCSQKSPKNH